jgi:hypothetical protein
VRVYRIDGQGLSWEWFGQVTYGNNVLDNFGMSVDITANGMIIICGSPRNYGFGDRPGYARVCSLVVGDNNIGTGSWKQIGGDIIGEANSNWFGYSVSLSNDRKTLAVGTRTNDGNKGRGSGHMRVYQRDADSKFGWMQLDNNIDGEAAYDNSGGSVSLSADGNTVAISSPYNDDNGISSFFVCHSSLQEKDGGTIVVVQCHNILIVVRGGGKVIKGAIVVAKSATGH